MKKATNKLYRELSKLIPEMKKDPKAWKKFLQSFVEKKPNSRMDPEFKKNLNQQILGAIRLKKQSQEPETQHWGHWLKLMMSLAGGFAVLTLVALPLIQGQPILMNLPTTHVEKTDGEKFLGPQENSEKTVDENKSEEEFQETLINNLKNALLQSTNNHSQSTTSEVVSGPGINSNNIHPNYLEYEGVEGISWYMNEDGYLLPIGGGGGSQTEGAQLTSQNTTYNPNLFPDTNLIHPDYLQYQNVPIEEWTLGADGLYRIDVLGGASVQTSDSGGGDYGGAVYRIESKPDLSHIDPAYVDWVSDVWLMEPNGYVPESEVPSGMGGGSGEILSDPQEENLTYDPTGNLNQEMENEIIEEEPEVEPEFQVSTPPPQMTYSQLVSTAIGTANSFLTAQGVDLSFYVPTLLTSLESALQTGVAVVRFSSLTGSVIEVEINIYSGTAQYR